MLKDDRIWMAQGQNPCYLLLNQANRHGLIAGASGTGKTVTLDLNGKVGTVVIPMKQQHMMSDFLNELTELLNVNILYSYNTEKGRVWRSVTYSMPYHDEMYIIGIESQMYGIVEEITVTFFDTLEIMFPWLRDNLESMQSSKEVFLHRQNITELYRIFM